MTTWSLVTLIALSLPAFANAGQPAAVAKGSSPRPGAAQASTFAPEEHHPSPHALPPITAAVGTTLHNDVAVLRFDESNTFQRASGEFRPLTFRGDCRLGGLFHGAGRRATGVKHISDDEWRFDLNVQRNAAAEGNGGGGRSGAAAASTPAVAASCSVVGVFNRADEYIVARVSVSRPAGQTFPNSERDAQVNIYLSQSKKNSDPIAVMSGGTSPDNAQMDEPAAIIVATIAVRDDHTCGGTLGALWSQSTSAKLAAIFSEQTGAAKAASATAGKGKAHTAVASPAHFCANEGADVTLAAFVSARDGSFYAYRQPSSSSSRNGVARAPVEIIVLKTASATDDATLTAMGKFAEMNAPKASGGGAKNGGGGGGAADGQPDRQKVATPENGVVFVYADPQSVDDIVAKVHLQSKIDNSKPRNTDRKKNTASSSTAKNSGGGGDFAPSKDHRAKQERHAMFAAAVGILFMAMAITLYVYTDDRPAIDRVTADESSPHRTTHGHFPTTPAAAGGVATTTAPPTIPSYGATDARSGGGSR